MSVKMALGYLSGLVLSLLTGCSSPSPRQLQLSYANDPEPNEGVVRLAPGTWLDVLASVQDAKKRYTVELNEVSSSDEQVALATLVNGDVRVEAKASGRSTILIQGVISPGEQAAQRELEIEVVEVAALGFEHHCGLSATPRYLTGQRLHVGVMRYDDQGRKLQGVGPAPVTLSSGAKVEPFRGLMPGLLFDAGEVEGELVIKSMIDEASLSLMLSAPTQIDGAILEGLRELRAGEREAFHVLPSIQGQPVCQAKLALKVEPLSSPGCEVTLESDLLSDMGSEAHLLTIDAQRAGVCRFKTLITIPGVAAPVETTHELVIKDAP